MAALLVGIAATLLSEWAKRSSHIPLSPDNTNAVRAVVVVLSVVGTVLSSWSSGQLATLDWTTVLNQIGGAIVSFAAATGIYHLLLKEKK